MNILLMKITIRSELVNSLKEKRMIVRSISQRLKNKFNISLGEVDNMDNHKLITIGISAICGNNKIADSMKEKILEFVDDNVEGEIIDILWDVEKF